MEKSTLDGTANEGLSELVGHHENQQERFRQPSSAAGEDHGNPNHPEEEKGVVP
jgi:hypothetical protein